MSVPKILLSFSLLMAPLLAWSGEYDYIVQQRLAAHDRMMAGELWEGATDLLSSLRALPVDEPEAADAALGSMQLMLFAVEYLMDAPLWGQFASEVMDPSQYPIDEYLHFLFQIYIFHIRSVHAMSKQEINRRVYREEETDHKGQYSRRHQADPYPDQKSSHTFRPVQPDPRDLRMQVSKSRRRPDGVQLTTDIDQRRTIQIDSQLAAAANRSQ